MQVSEQHRQSHFSNLNTDEFRLLQNAQKWCDSFGFFQGTENHGQARAEDRVWWSFPDHHLEEPGSGNLSYQLQQF